MVGVDQVRACEMTFPFGVLGVGRGYGDVLAVGVCVEVIASKFGHGGQFAQAAGDGLVVIGVGVHLVLVGCFFGR